MRTANNYRHRRPNDEDELGSSSLSQSAFFIKKVVPLEAANFEGHGKGTAFMQNQYTKLLDLIPSCHKNTYRVRLNTPFKPLFIGVLDTKSEGRFITQKSEERHFHRNSHGIAINAALLLNPEYKFRWIEVEFVHADGKREKLVTSREYIKAKGTPFCYKGWEPQVALELSLWGKAKALRFQQESHSQTDLFAIEAA